MKKVLLFLAMSFLFSSQVFAYVSGNAAIADKIIFCPQITCTKAGDPTSCGIDKNDDQQYWNPIFISKPYKVIAGTYQLSSVNSSYRNNQSSALWVLCTYSYNTNDKITVTSKSESNLEAYNGANATWIINGTDRVGCYGRPRSSCPLIERLGVGLSVRSVSGYRAFSLDFTINGVNVASNLQSGQNAFISYEKAINCWNSKICNIEVYSTSDGQKTFIGTLKVDMDNKMKIILPIPSANQDFSFKIVEPFNTLLVESLKNSPPSPITISTNINLKMNLSVNDVVIAELDKNQTTNLNYETVKKICGVTKTCSINITADHGAIIGSFDVDVENDITVISTSSVRASEIHVNKIDAHRVDVGYSS